MIWKPSINYAPITLAEWDGSWQEDFDRRAHRIKSALGGVASRVDHIGSTAVPGLVAKPTIDIQVSVHDLGDLPSYERPLAAVGYTFHDRSLREADHRFFSTPRRTAHVHVCPSGSDWERRHLLFRDYLRAHPAEAEAYANVKRRLARIHTSDREAYSDAKSEFIDVLMERADAWAMKAGWIPD